MTGDKTSSYLPYFAIAIGAALLFIPFLGTVALFDWDEVNFAEIAREMIVTGDYLTVQIDYRPFWEKPPLFMWMQVLSMKLFGINEFAARFPNAICGMLTLLLIYRIGSKIHDNKLGLIWTLVYAGSILPFFYFKSGIIDPWFNLFIFLGIYFALLFFHQLYHPPVKKNYRAWYIFLSGAAIGLAILTKGPVGFLLFALTGFIFLIITLFQSSRTKVLQSSRPTFLQSYSLPILLFITGLILTGGSWFLIQIANGHWETVKDFIIYQVRLFNTKDAGHGGFPGYHIVILLLGVFPASAFLFAGLKKTEQPGPLQKNFRLAMIILLATVVVLFEIVQTKIVHYSSLAYFPLTYLSASYLHALISGKAPWRKSAGILLPALTLFWALAILAFTFVALNKDRLIAGNLVKDPFAVANLAADIRWTGLEALITLPLLSGLAAFFILKNPLYKVMAVFAGSIVFTFLTMTVITGKIEGYAQRAALDFYREKSGEDAYIRTLGFKSYAHMYYGQSVPQKNPQAADMEWLLHGPIDKPAYFVYKITRKEEYSRIYPHLHILYEKNGFIFAARYPENKP